MSALTECTSGRKLSDHHGKRSGFHDARITLSDEGEVFGIKSHGHCLLLARLEQNLAESLQLFDRARNRTVVVIDIQLNDFGTGDPSGILDIHGNGEFLRARECRPVKLEIVV